MCARIPPGGVAFTCRHCRKTTRLVDGEEAMRGSAWIRPGWSLPPENTLVLIVFEGEICLGEWRRQMIPGSTGPGWKLFLGMFWRISTEVDAWMPLPRYP